ncbi:TolC family protein [Natronospirillum operosum]|uniref:TolC family protein n=1 Tax=Natronospirillum operosum TaxID=2759953 RepID=A0A4Z0W927_9GAMM|nr:TolC family protein [Natronospirillum operosum]TGG90292.1 TolC family protein [Natronospirillum operosum]
MMIGRSNTPIVCLLLASVGLADRLVAEPVLPEMDPVTYLNRVAVQELRILEHRARQPAEALALQQAEEWYIPDLTLSSRWEDETRREPATSEQRGLTSRLDSDWTTLLGTEVNLGLEYQYGEQVSDVPSGLPEDYQENQQVSLDIQQPVLRGFTPAFNRIPIQLAREDRARFDSQGELHQFEAQRDAVQDLIELQRLADRVQVEQALLTHYEHLLDTTETLWLEGQSTELDVDLARLDVAEQAAASARSEAELQRQQRQLGLRIREPVAVTPLDSLAQLIDWLQPVEQVEFSPGDHPELQVSLSEQRSARLSVTRAERDHWPEVSLFYRFEKDYRESVPDQETEAFGIRLSYALRDIATRETQRRAEADRDAAQWRLQDARGRLLADRDRAQEELAETRHEIALLRDGLTLSEQALAHEVARYEQGFSSLLDVERRQEDLLNRQMALLDAQARLANGLTELVYLTHQDIRRWL